MPAASGFPDLNIDEIRKQIVKPKQADESAWLTAIREGLKALAPQQQKENQRPVAGPREYEAWLAAILRSLSEARVASTDWLQVVAAQDAIWIQLNDTEGQLQALVGEDLPGRLFAQTQLDKQISHTELAARHKDQHAARIDSVIQTIAAEKDRTLLADAALAFVQYKRDTAPAPSENFARGTDDTFKPFDDKARVLDGSIAATKYLAEQTMANTAARDSDEVASAREQAAELRDTIPALQQAIENLGNDRKSLERRRALLEQKRDLLTDRLYGKHLDFERRKEVILQRYDAAVSSLAARTQGFVDALTRVLGPFVKATDLSNLVQLSKFDDSDRGAQVDLYEIQIRKIEDWCDFISAMTQRTVRTKAMVLEPTGDAGYSGECSFEAADLPAGCTLTRVRGMRLSAPKLPAPTLSRQSISRKGETIADQDAWITPYPGLTDQLWGVKQFWNARVEGPWEIGLTVPNLPAGIKEIECVLEILFDYLPGGDELQHLQY
ncbi:hypothetical protein [Burkholderia sp. Ac-20365]|uniref:hypothetical protein n=1 Tax=Burkholderia sp. Ac-20365 TaxID=2703897 RepID=UPI00197C47FB|nr:hypothetical protein [Burkholderia sp. Ac-20365]MBN3761117.1 keratin [Burkholderia sp. Ac-20365]